MEPNYSIHCPNLLKVCYTNGPQDIFVAQDGFYKGNVRIIRANFKESALVSYYHKYIIIISSCQDKLILQVLKTYKKDSRVKFSSGTFNWSVDFSMVGIYQDLFTIHNKVNNILEIYLIDVDKLNFHIYRNETVGKNSFYNLRTQQIYTGDIPIIGFDSGSELYVNKGSTILGLSSDKTIVHPYFAKYNCIFIKENSWGLYVGFMLDDIIKLLIIREDWCEEYDVLNMSNFYNFYLTNTDAIFYLSNRIDHYKLKIPEVEHTEKRKSSSSKTVKFAV